MVTDKRLKVCPQCRSSNVELVKIGSLATEKTKESPSRAIDRIREALETTNPSKSGVLRDLLSLQADVSIPKFEFFDTIGLILQERSQFFMLSIYSELGNRLSVIYGAEGMREMDKYLLEKYCFSQGEQIIYELNGRISQLSDDFIGRVKGTIYITNSGIIAHGKFNSYPLKGGSGSLVPSTFQRRTWGLSPKGKQDFLIRSLAQYGYTFPTVNLHGLKMSNRKLSYSSSNNDRIRIIPSRIEEHRDKLFAILSKFQKQN